MHRDILAYWRSLENLPQGHEDRPSPRVCRLLLETFELWQTQQPFPAMGWLGHLRDHLNQDDPPDAMDLPVSVRRGLALRKTLELLTSERARRDGFFAVNPDELILGVMPPYSVGQGKEVMEYLKDERDDHDEALASDLNFLNPWSNFGHIVPNHEKVVRRGLRSIIEECSRLRELVAAPDRKAFYSAAIHALEGVILFAGRYADLAESEAGKYRDALAGAAQHPQQEVFEERAAGMAAAAERLRRIPAEPCRSFTDAVQCIYLMNCALHWTGELTSLGRLDQILAPYLEADTLSADEAQIVIDCLWVKLDQRVVLDPRHVVDRFTSSDGALLGAGGPSNFDQGGLANQWMQQITIGGVKAADGPAEDASNAVTRMCLEAARRLPFNCPTLDLRVHQGTPDDLLELAARALLSGGAHPILMNDDKIVPRLHQDSGAAVDLASARNYACDGCYETVFAGETEFSFIYIPGVDVLEKALNSGAGLAAAGSVHLRGTKAGYRTPQAADIPDFESFWAILEAHIRLSVHRQLAGLLRAYGSKGDVCPSPILSAMIDGCVESGRDLYAGGARYKMFAPLMTGISTAADSLYVIKTLVFDRGEFSLEELVACLRANWGRNSSVVGRRPPLDRIRQIRGRCVAQPKFGQGVREVDALAWRLSASFIETIDQARDHPVHRPAWESLRERYDLADHPLRVLLTPGVGTFEQYVFGGGFAGATPDGRYAGEPLASDLAASPLPLADDDPARPADSDPILDAQLARETRLIDALPSWNDAAFERFSDGAPADFNIREDFPRQELVRVLRAFADGQGGNMMTVTVADPETLRDAARDPGRHQLVRVRMGGWTEFFSVLSSAHQSQHRRRPLYVA